MKLQVCRKFTSKQLHSLSWEKTACSN